MREVPEGRSMQSVTGLREQGALRLGGGAVLRLCFSKRLSGDAAATGLSSQALCEGFSCSCRQGYGVIGGMDGEMRPDPSWIHPSTCLNFGFLIYKEE